MASAMRAGSATGQEGADFYTKWRRSIIEEMKPRPPRTIFDRLGKAEKPVQRTIWDNLGG